MSRTTEILRRFPPDYFDRFEKTPAAEPLWPRFEKIKNLVFTCLQEKPIEGISRNISQMNWAGVDSGIHDYSGEIKGVSCGIGISFNIKGTIIDDQTKYDENWKLIHEREKYIKISGKFTSLDGRQGKFQMTSINDIVQMEAYWFENISKELELIQVVNSKGEAYDARKLKIVHNNITIPSTQITVSMLKTS